MPAKNIKKIMIYSIRGELNSAILPSLVENPPVDVVVNAWLIASKKDMPLNISSIISRKVSPKYIIHNRFAVSFIRG